MERRPSTMIQEKHIRLLVKKIINEEFQGQKDMLGTKDKQRVIKLCIQYFGNYPIEKVDKFYKQIMSIVDDNINQEEYFSTEEIFNETNDKKQIENLCHKYFKNYPQKQLNMFFKTLSITIGDSDISRDDTSYDNDIGNYNTMGGSGSASLTDYW